MKVVILCGGLGTRLREHTEHLPKPMVPVGRWPIVWHIMKTYAHHGHREFILCLGYKGHMIKDFFRSWGPPAPTPSASADDGMEVHPEGEAHPWRVWLVDTGHDAMTGARVKRVAHLLDSDRFMLTYGDGVANIDISRLVAFHTAHRKLATVTGVHPPARFGELLLDGSAVRRFSEKPQVRDSWINGGFFVFERAFLDYLSEDAGCILERGPLERVAADAQLEAYLHDDYWQCMDTYRDWKLLNTAWASGSCPWAVWDSARPPEPS